MIRSPGPESPPSGHPEELPADESPESPSVRSTGPCESIVRTPRWSYVCPERRKCRREAESMLVSRSPSPGRRAASGHQTGSSLARPPRSDRPQEAGRGPDPVRRRQSRPHNASGQRHCRTRCSAGWCHSGARRFEAHTPHPGDMSRHRIRGRFRPARRVTKTSCHCLWDR